MIHSAAMPKCAGLMITLLGIYIAQGFSVPDTYLFSMETQGD